ncbi:MAG: biotin/lipoyl-containing protein [Ignavibacteriota bacterium]
MNLLNGRIDGQPFEVEKTWEVTELQPGQYIVRKNSELKEMFRNSDGSLTDGNSLGSVEVTTESEKERIIRERFKLRGDSTVDSGTPRQSVLKAPMPGMVRTIHVSVGDHVKKDTPVMIIEAMKMENSINAGFEGIVEKILTDIEMPVEKNMIVMEFRAI